MVEIIIDPEYRGPSILELESSLPDITSDTVDVQWTNTKPEFYTFQKFRGKKKFRLFVKDLTAQERAFTFLGRPLDINSNLIERGKLSLGDENWREYASELSPSVTRSILAKIAADHLRQGKNVRLASIAKDCLLNDINPVDADVLFRLRVLRGY